MKKEVENWELCYIHENFAFFQPDHMSSTGDDWNDRPYEHNADEPYGRSYVIMFDAREKWNDEGQSPVFPKSNHCNSLYCVDDINRRKLVPWVVVEAGPMFAGVGPTEFVKKMTESGRACIGIGFEGVDDE